MDIALTRIFVKVVQNSSFTKAAELLKLPKSTISKSITRLEKETGTKLLVRTTRSLTLTAAGRVFYETCLGPIQTLEDAQKSLYGADSILSGVVRITAPEDMGSYVIAPALSELVNRHPSLSFDLLYTNEVIDLVKDGFDIAIRIGKLKESNLKAKKIGEVSLCAIASPEYLKNKPRIQAPQDLEMHSCLNIIDLPDKWNLHSKKGATAISIEPRIRCNQTTSLMSAAIAGAGIAFVPNFICKDHFESGALVRVLPEWRSVGLPVSLVSPTALASSARLKVTGDLLYAALQKALSLH